MNGFQSWRAMIFVKAGVMLLTTGTLQAQVRVGVEILIGERLELIREKRLGIIANQTSLDGQGRHIVDLLARHARITAVFAPEHGFRGDVEDAVSIRDEVHKDIQVHSLYGEFLAPTPGMLRDVDVLIYDIQDVGVKFYTFVSTLFLAMKAAADAGIPVIVCDRPNPIDGSRLEGAVTYPAYASFVGVIPLPIRYGMTIGELARLFNQESFAGFRIQADLTVIPMTGYRRGMWYDETGFPWTATSPNMPTPETAMIYPGMCLLEGTNLSEGRGTDAPFLTVGAAYIDAEKWLDALPREVLKGIRAEPVEFTPRSIPGVVSRPKYLGQRCQGLWFTVNDPGQFKPIPLAVALLCAAQRLYPSQFKMNQYMDKLWGNENLRAMVEEGADYRCIMDTCRAGIERFKVIREKYLVYEQ
jgi:uncharacterized protein YbbC (DUF1343 family)